MHDVQETLLIAIGLVILVIFLFLRSVSATIIPALAVPISLIGTCAVMYAFDFSINNMTLLALTLSVGFVVDDAIVMLENIVRHIEGGMRPFEAALKGAREIGFTIISITFSLIAVFIPVLLMGGMVGRVFREFAVTIAVAIIMSGLRVADADADAVRARAARPSRGREAERRAARVRGDVQALAAGLRMDARQGARATSRSCCWSRSPRWSARSSSTSSIPKGFFPRRGHRLHLGDDRRRRPTSRSAPWSSGRTQGRRHHPQGPGGATTSIRRSASAGPNSTLNTGRMFVALKPQERARRRSSDDHSRGCAARPASVIGMAVYFQMIQNINIGGRISKGEFQYTMQSSETETLYRSRRDARQDRQGRRACATSTATSTSRTRR